VSTVNYIAAGSCNFNNGGVTIWPLNQIVADPKAQIRKIAEFLGQKDIDQAAMVAAVDEKLYRKRRPNV
jgi:hypothetical protein